MPWGDLADIQDRVADQTLTQKGPDTGLFYRRTVLGLGAGGVAVYAAYRAGLFGRLFGPAPFDFQAMEAPSGFRRLPSGPVTGGSVPLFGLDGEKPPELLAAQEAVTSDLCGTLFPNIAPGSVPVAYFYDYQCPICRRLTPMLRDIPGLTLNWHDLAGLGAASETAARAAIAAREQGAFDAFHDRLMRARFQPNEGYILSLAESAGIDGDRLLTDMGSVKTTDQMWLSRALANKFALIGTPGLVVGRTAVLGDISRSDLTRLVALERENPGPCG